MIAPRQAAGPGPGRPSHRLAAMLATIKRRLYPGRRPSAVAQALNRVIARQHALGLLTTRGSATLVVTGRRSGRPVRLPLVVVDLDGAQYLVSMLGEQASWVRNVRAAGGRARLLRHRQQHPVRLVEVPTAERAPVLRRYLQVAPGARPHLAVSRWAPLTELARVAGDHPVFQVRPDGEQPAAPGGH